VIGIVRTSTISPKALEDRASALRIELDKIQRAIQAMAETKTPTRRKFRHTAETILGVGSACITLETTKGLT
jgi:hypothetical protein